MTLASLAEFGICCGIGDQERGQGPGNGVALLQGLCLCPHYPFPSHSQSPPLPFRRGCPKDLLCRLGTVALVFLGERDPRDSRRGLVSFGSQVRAGRGMAGGGRREICVTWTLGKVVALCPYYARAEAGGLAFKGKRALQPLPPHPHLQIDNDISVPRSPHQG